MLTTAATVRLGEAPLDTVIARLARGARGLRDSVGPPEVAAAGRRLGGDFEREREREYERRGI